jgi:hypothetical protein
VNVEIGSDSWSPGFVEYLQTSGLGTNGYAIPVGSSAQSATLPWTGLNQIHITFSEDVYIDATDLSLSGVNTSSYAFSDFHYDPQLCLATWTTSSPLQKDRLRLDLDADGLDPVRDLDGNILDGEWTNNSDTYASGNGTAGGDFEFNFNVLPCDVNKSSNVTYLDCIYINQLQGKSTTDNGYNPFRDLDGSGLIDSEDYQTAVAHVLDALPSGTPAGTYNDAPSTTHFDLVEITADDIDVAVSLLGNFDDAESGSSGLTYSIVGNSDPSLFDYVSINQSTGELILNAASFGGGGSAFSAGAGASGRAAITVRGTDPGGQSKDAVVTVDVNYVNEAPLILNFDISYAGAGTWIISGDVVDPDDDVSDFIVYFSGVFDTRSAVDENGHFEFAWILDPEEYGFEFAITHDPHGLESNTAFREIGWV